MVTSLISCFFYARAMTPTTLDIPGYHCFPLPSSLLSSSWTLKIAPNCNKLCDNHGDDSTLLTSSPCMLTTLTPFPCISALPLSSQASGSTARVASSTT